MAHSCETLCGLYVDMFGNRFGGQRCADARLASLQQVEELRASSVPKYPVLCFIWRLLETNLCESVSVLGLAPVVLFFFYFPVADLQTDGNEYFHNVLGWRIGRELYGQRVI